jgi:hypothetical protein
VKRRSEFGELLHSLRKPAAGASPSSHYFSVLVPPICLFTGWLQFRPGWFFVASEIAALALIVAGLVIRNIDMPSVRADEARATASEWISFFCILIGMLGAVAVAGVAAYYAPH